MLSAATISFLEEIAHNNNKPWFDANRDRYVAAKEDFEIMVTDLLKGLAKLEPAFAEQKAKDCIFRIFRDVRFGKDKTPYKPNFGAYFSKGGKKFPGAGYYLHVEPGGKTFAGGGLWMPESPILKAVRQEIDYNFDEFKLIVEDKKFKKVFSEMTGESAKKAPTGYTEDNPAIKYIKLKSFVVSNNITDKEIQSKTFVKTVTDTFTTMQPLIEFLNRGAEIS
jgi:uncharacterized protein (TIGR02453 family)